MILNLKFNLKLKYINVKYFNQLYKYIKINLMQFSNFNIKKFYIWNVFVIQKIEKYYL